jgi:hypothetical protein
VYAPPSNFAIPRRFNACIECIEDAVERVAESVTGIEQMRALDILSSKLHAFEERLFHNGATLALTSLRHDFERRERGAEQTHDQRMRREKMLLRQALARVKKTNLLARRTELLAEMKRTTDADLLSLLNIHLQDIMAQAKLDEQDWANIAAATRQSTEPGAEVYCDDDANERDVTSGDIRSGLSAVAERAQEFVGNAERNIMVAAAHQHHHTSLQQEGISFLTKCGEARQVPECHAHPAHTCHACSLYAFVCVSTHSQVLACPCRLASACELSMQWPRSAHNSRERRLLLPTNANLHSGLSALV